MTGRSITDLTKATSCYFRTSVDPPYRKALVQIDERCNLRCTHCFVSATKQGAWMSLGAIVNTVIPCLVGCRVRRVTLTGGEPTLHPDFLNVVRLFRAAQIDVGICTKRDHADRRADRSPMAGVRCNVSMDGFSPDSHGSPQAGHSSQRPARTTAG